MASIPPDNSFDLAVEPRKNAWRERVKAEIEELRHQIWHLENELHELQYLQPRATEQSHHGTRHSLAAIENQRLRKAIEQQLETGRNLVQALTGLTTDELGVDLFSVARTLLPNPSSLDSLSDRFALSLAEVERAYKQIDSVLGPARLDCARRHRTCSFFTRAVDGHQELVLEMREDRVAHFDFTRYCAIVWKAIEQMPWKGFEAEREAISQAELIAIRLRFQRAMRGSSLHLTTQVLVKRFVASDHLVIVWHAVTVLDNNNNDLADVFIEDTGFCRINRSEDSASGTECVLKQSCMQSVPRTAGRRSLRELPHAGSFTNLVMSASHGAVGAIEDLVETMLIDDCMSDFT